MSKTGYSKGIRSSCFWWTTVLNDMVREFDSVHLVYRGGKQVTWTRPTTFLTEAGVVRVTGVGPFMGPPNTVWDIRGVCTVDPIS